MLDLKAKLAGAGLVSQDDIERVEQEAKRGEDRGQRRAKKPADTGLAVAQLRGKPKSEVYPAVRRWVEKVRLDPAGGVPSEAATPFHFAEVGGRIGRLTLEPELVAKLQVGEAGVIAYMSNHGRAHAVVPSDCARSLADLDPLALRVLEGDARAGNVEPAS